MTTEEWRWLPGWVGAYEVSDQGRVRSWCPRPRSKKQRTEPLILADRADGFWGYRCLTLRGRPYRIHELVLAAFVGPRPEGMDVRHLNGNHLDNRLANLAYGTHSENMLDQVRHGTHANAAKTHCKRGHEFNTINTRIELHPDGSVKQRHCRVCHRLRRNQPVSTPLANTA